MSRTFTLAVCNSLAPEFSEIIRNGDYPDVRLVSFDAACNSSFDPRDISRNIISAEYKDTDFVILGSTCINPESLESDDHVKFVNLSQCFEPFLSNDLILHFIKDGNYLVTNGWLRKLSSHLKNWGFKDPSMARTFFGEALKKILFLDTGIKGEFLPDLETLSDYMGLPYEILPIGLDTCKLYLDSIVLDWRNEKERNSINLKLSEATKKQSEMLVVFNQLELLVNLTKENDIIDVALNLINILYAPSNIRYIKFIDGKRENVDFKNSEKVKNDPGNSFSIEVYHQKEIFGIINIDGVKFPDHIDQYKEMGKTISQILSISIANARKFTLIHKQKAQIEEYSLELKKSNITKDRFFSIIAHDLKGHFNNMLGFSDLLINELNNSNPEKIERFATIINTNLNNTFNLLVNLLDWSRSQLNEVQCNPKMISVSNVLDEILNLVMSQAKGKSVDIKMEISDKLQLHADENMFRTIFRNLISNAIKFSNTNGIIIISSETKDNYLRLIVSDNGIGMSSETVNSLFKDASGPSKLGTLGEKGTGLGLILCKEFISKHNGRISVESEIENGSTFYVDFPLT